MRKNFTSLLACDWPEALAIPPVYVAGAKQVSANNHSAIIVNSKRILLKVWETTSSYTNHCKLSDNLSRWTTTFRYNTTTRGLYFRCAQKWPCQPSTVWGSVVFLARRRTVAKSLNDTYLAIHPRTAAWTTTLDFFIFSYCLRVRKPRMYLCSFNTASCISEFFSSSNW